MWKSFVVTAHVDGDTWSYGPFMTKDDAENMAMVLAQKYPNIEYSVGDLFRVNAELELLREPT